MEFQPPNFANASSYIDEYIWGGFGLDAWDGNTTGVAITWILASIIRYSIL
jgi:hypothetical protein